MIVLDLSRLLSRAGSATPSGIDRVEMAYARYLLASEHPHGFAALNAVNRIGALPHLNAGRFIAALSALWREGGVVEDHRETAVLARELRRATLSGERTLHGQMEPGGSTPVYLLVSHHHLDRRRPIERLKAASSARFVCFIHDLIPLDFPQYTRPSQTRRHRRRIATTRALADAIIVNSDATRLALQRHLDGDLPITVAPLGLASSDSPKAAADRPYFVCIGTVEARKNHVLLLEVWRRLVAEFGDSAPRLLLIGQRGWRGKEIAARLQSLRDFISEHRDLPDRDMLGLLRGARALLLPSFVEGFGLPVIEALAAGIPVICSDLPALRESGGNVPDYLDPHDAGAWQAAILDFMADSPRRQAQLARLTAWQPPSWRDHFVIVEQLIAGLT